MTDIPDGLQARGSLLWSALGHSVGTPSGELALEACRIADRLEKLDALIRGDRWVDLIQPDEDDATTLVVVVDKALTEARGQQSTLLAILLKLGIETKVGEKPTKGANPLAQVIALVQSGTNTSGGSA
jgi:hypothetical protein